MKLFNKKKKSGTVELCDFDGMNISTGQVCSYICYLFKEYDFRHIGWNYRKVNGCLRFALLAIDPTPYMINYFNDRSNNEILNECKSAPKCEFISKTYSDGFSEYVPAD